MRRAANQSRESGGGAGDAPGVRRVEAAVRASLARRSGAPELVLAVSGGRDSMVLLHAAARLARARVAAVATYDHASGPHAPRAVALVERAVASYGLRVVAGAAGASPGARRGEAGWRAERWAFLRAVVARFPGSVVATAHTEDDQLETVFMRALRGAGARGLAGLYAASDIVRPLLAVTATDVRAYARRHAVEFVDDPSNESRRFLRNRVRHDLLPAAARVRPTMREELLALARRAAAWRREVETLVEQLALPGTRVGELGVSLADVRQLDEAGLAVVWPALAARVGVTLDRRGTRRVAGFTMVSKIGDVMPLSGGATVRRTRERFVLRRGEANISSRGARGDGSNDAGRVVALEDGVRCGAFAFRRARAPHPAEGEPSAWATTFDAAATLTVRPWAPGDRMGGGAGRAARRVKRFFGDARVPAHERRGWPVVLADGVIVWIPGVRRTDAATVRPGWPGVRYECDRNDG